MPPELGAEAKATAPKTHRKRKAGENTGGGAVGPGPEAQEKRPRTGWDTIKTHTIGDRTTKA